MRLASRRATARRPRRQRRPVSTERVASREIQLLVAGLDEAFDHKAWHGTTLRGSIRGLAAPAAAWRPGRMRHSTWEIVTHCAYWKYVVRRRLTGAPKGGFVLDGSNWFPQPRTLTERAWQDAVAVLVNEHRQLRKTVARFSPTALDRSPAGSPFTYAALIRGIAAHDLYHAGQIQLLKRLHKK